MLDGHNDFPILIRSIYKNHIYDPDFAAGFERDGLPGHVDLPRLKSGKNGGAFWSVFAPCPENGTDFSDENYAECKSLCG
jgi:membrane dipeptidase